ncbi:MAG: glucose-6-phosphate dehydrogenase [Sedimentisphaerales bacterium]|nr:glucose-6-phosphate dehydrogenase [Sedimentisphaerales bacterium]
MKDDKGQSESVESRHLRSCEASLDEWKGGPVVVVIFGGAGDLGKRMLLPTLFTLYREKKLAADSYILGAGRRAMSDEQYRGLVRQSLERFGAEAVERGEIERFCRRVAYLEADVRSDETYTQLCRRIAQISSQGRIKGLIHYLAVPPSLIEPIIEGLFVRGLCTGSLEPKVVVEKPFGSDKASASRLNELILKHFKESQVYRIDHYLGKETVQNILFFRFGNSIFEPLWNRRYIDHVQITVAEDIGIEGRGEFYDAAGVVRDIVQNHIMQLMGFVAMEPPSGFEANLVRDEKVKVFRAIRPMSDEYIDEFMVRGQYGAGMARGEAVCGYREEEKVTSDSNTPTFFAGRFYIDNWRWANVPFYVRTGKRLSRRVTEICVVFKQPPLRLLGRTCDIIEPNCLVLSIQPSEEMSLQLNVKKPGGGNEPYAINMNFDYAKSFEVKSRPAYERLLLDCLKGDLTLFARSDEVEAMWDVVDPVVSRWESAPARDFPNYDAGSDGPKESAALMDAGGRKWRRI